MLSQVVPVALLILSSEQEVHSFLQVRLLSPGWLHEQRVVQEEGQIAVQFDV